MKPKKKPIPVHTVSEAIDILAQALLIDCLDRKADGVGVGRTRKEMREWAARMGFGMSIKQVMIDAIMTIPFPKKPKG